MSDVKIVGVLNITPDSYFDGGKYVSVDAAVARVGEMLAEGADVIEIGGESTGPGSTDIPVDVELQRVIPVIEAIRSAYPDASLSIDTYKAAVAVEALKRCVAMVNDVTAGRGDPELFSGVAKTDAKLVLMYTKDETPRTTIADRQYDDVVSTIAAFLKQRKQAAVAAGIAEDRIILDPGMGHFISSDPKYSFEALDRLGELASLGSPILVSPSRKSFLAGEDNLPPSERLPATIVASLLAAKNGATYIRTHDVAELRSAL